jgi:hypothetical protein
MWDDVIIGKNKTGVQICTSIKVFDISVDNISENSLSYWITDCILDTGMTVYKDTPEGKKITQLIENKASKAKIQNYLDKIVLTKLSPMKLKAYIKREKEKSFEEGKRAKQEEIKDVLGIRERMW